MLHNLDAMLKLGWPSVTPQRYFAGFVQDVDDGGTGTRVRCERVNGDRQRSVQRRFLD